MVNFEKLVESFLFEADEADKKDLEAFLNSVKAYQELKDIFNKKFKEELFPFVSEQEFKDMAYNAANASLRDTKDSDKYPKIKDVYPLLDLFAILTRYLKKGSTQKEEAVNAYSAFKTKLNEDINLKVPLDYRASNTWAQTVKADYFTTDKLDIGKTRLESINQNYSIYSTILYLLALRRQRLGKKLNLDKIPPANKFIDDIFFNPVHYIQGKETLPPDEKLKLMYTNTSSDLLLKVSMAVYKLFKQQANQVLGSNEQGNLDITNEAVAYKEFLGDGSQAAFKRMNWNKYKPEGKEASPANVTPPTAQQMNASFDSSLELAYKQMLNEGELKSAAELAMDRFSSSEKNNSNEETKPEETSPEEPKNEEPKTETRLQPFEVENNSYLYTLGQIAKNKEQVPAAKNLYNELINLGNFIQKEEQSNINWTGAIQGATQAIGGLQVAKQMGK